MCRNSVLTPVCESLRKKFGDVVADLHLATVSTFGVLVVINTLIVLLQGKKVKANAQLENTYSGSATRLKGVKVRRSLPGVV